VSVIGLLAVDAAYKNKELNIIIIIITFNGSGKVDGWIRLVFFL
jgi:hypothetical protein